MDRQIRPVLSDQRNGPDVLHDQTVNAHRIQFIDEADQFREFLILIEGVDGDIDLGIV